MRITAVTTSVPGLRKPRLLGFVRALRLAGHDVRIIATSDFSQGGRANGHDGEAILRDLGVPIEHVPFSPDTIQIGRAVASVMLRRSVSETALYECRDLSRRITIAVDSTSPDVVHVDRCRALPLVRDGGFPLIVDVTDPRDVAYQHYRRAGRLSPLRVGIAEIVRARIDQRPAEREEESGLAGIPALVASEAGRRSLLKCGVDPRGVSHVPNAVFTDERVAPLTRVSGARLVIGMSGNLSYPPNVLGFDVLARDIAPVLRDGIAARMIVVGSDPPRLLRRRARRANIEVYRDVANVPQTLRRLGASLMVSPQRVSAGFPNRVIDAVYRTGIPIIVSPETRVGAPEALARGLPVADRPEEWLQQTRALLSDGTGPELVAELQRLIDQVCGPHVVVEALLSAYDQAMKARTH